MSSTRSLSEYIADHSRPVSGSDESYERLCKALARQEQAVDELDQTCLRSQMLVMARLDSQNSAVGAVLSMKQYIKIDAERRHARQSMKDLEVLVREYEGLIAEAEEQNSDGVESQIGELLKKAEEIQVRRAPAPAFGTKQELLTLARDLSAVTIQKLSAARSPVRISVPATSLRSKSCRAA